MNRFRALFGQTRPVIAMVHLGALPGAPLHDADAGMEAIVEAARADLLALQAAGVDAVMVGNENDRPYQLSVEPASVAAMAYAVGRLRAEIAVPLGVDVLWDARATVAVAAATGAAFAREILTGTYASDMGLWVPEGAAALRDRARLGRPDLALLANVSAEFAGSLDPRSLPERARSAAFSSIPDAILVSGAITGEAAAMEDLEAVRRAVPTDLPVLANTGVRIETVAEVLRVADGCVVGTALKRDGVTWNPVDPERAAAFVAAAKGR